MTRRKNNQDKKKMTFFFFFFFIPNIWRNSSTLKIDVTFTTDSRTYQCMSICDFCYVKAVQSKNLYFIRLMLRGWSILNGEC